MSRKVPALPSSFIASPPQTTQTASGTNAQRLLDIFFAHRGNVSDKWEQYLLIYEAELRRLVSAGRAVRLLEIGVQNGGSLQIWSSYLPLGSTITGIDIDPVAGQLSLAPNVRVLVGDASDPATLARLLGGACFDVIIDDGSHRSDHIIASFEACFPRLAPGGLYVVEDMHCSYLASFGGGFRKPGAAMEHFKALADALNADHFEPDAEVAGAQGLIRLRTAGQEIARITFYDSVVVVEKLSAPKTRPFRRLITGSEHPVADLARLFSQDMSARQLHSLVLSPAATAAFETPMRDALAMQREETSTQAAIADERRLEIERLRTEQRTLSIELNAEREKAVQYQADLQNTQSALRRTQNTLRHTQDHIKLLLTSSSWRITAPVRMFVRVGRDPRSAARELERTTKRAKRVISRDGLGPTLKRSLRMLQQDGLLHFARTIGHTPTLQYAPEGIPPDAQHPRLSRKQRFVPERDPRLDPYCFNNNAERAAVAQHRSPVLRMRKDPTPGLSVVILNRDKPELILPLLDALIGARAAFSTRGLSLQVLIGDTGSTDPAVLNGYSVREQACSVVRSLKYQFSDCNNTVAAFADHHVLLFLNNDVIFDDAAGTLLALYEAVVLSERGTIAGLVMQFDGGERLQHGGVDFFRSGASRALPFHPAANEKRSASSFPAVSDVPAVTGACLAVRADIFRRVSGFDTRYTAECQDIDLCLKVRRIGGRCVLLSNGRTIHLENATRPRGEENFADRRLFIRRWTAWLEATGYVEPGN